MSRVVIRCVSASGWGSETAFAPPHPALRGFVRSYHGFGGATPGGSTRIIPSTDTIVVFTFNGREVVTDSATGDRSASPGAMVTGIWGRAVWSGLDHGWNGVQINIPPLGAFALLQTPLHPLADRQVDLRDILGAAAPALQEELAEAPDWETRFDRLDRLFLERLKRNVRASPVVQAGWRRLLSSRGDRTVRGLAGELGCGRGHLWGRFRDEVGASPKLVARIVRFRRAIEQYRRRPQAGWGAVAHACGFYDQSHLGREARDLAGLSPRQLVEWDGFGPAIVHDEP